MKPTLTVTAKEYPVPGAKKLCLPNGNPARLTSWQIFKGNTHNLAGLSVEGGFWACLHLATRRVLINRRAAETNCELISKLPRNKVSAE